MRKKRIYFILSGENLFHPNYLYRIINQWDKNKFKAVGITIAKERYRKGILYSVKQQFGLWGMTGFLFIAASNYTKAALSKLNIGKSSSIKKIAKDNKIPLTESENVNDLAHINYLKKRGVDIIISSNGQIFKNDLLNLPKIACINRHSALLPSYGGVLPVFWAMLNKENEFGITIHHMVEKIDKGKILFQIPITLDRKNSLFANYTVAFDKSIRATIKALDNLLDNKTIKANGKSSYFSFPDDKTIKKFKGSNNAFSFKDIFKFKNFLLL